MSKEVKVGLGVLIWKDKEVLMVRKCNSHGECTWSPQGGHLDYGETPLECAIREVNEEIHLNLKSVE